MPVIHPSGADPVGDLDPDLAAGGRAIGMVVAMRLRELTPALRPADDDGREPTLVLEEVALLPADPTDALTLVACVAAHDAYVNHRRRPGAVSPGALALARVLVWASRAEMLGRAPSIVWIGPPNRRPESADGYPVTASVRLTGPSGTVRATACGVVAPV